MLQSHLHVALLACALTCSMSLGSVGLVQQPEASTEQEAPAEKATAWPEPKDEAALKKAVAKVRRAHLDGMEEAGRSEIQLEGAAAAPLLIKAIAKERDDDALVRLTSALDLVTTKEYTRLLAEHLEHKSPNVRVAVMKRLATLGDPGLRDQAEALYKAVAEKSKDAKKAKKLHQDELTRASILCLSTDSRIGLDHTLSIAGSKGWAAWRTPMRAAAKQAKAAGTDVASALIAVLDPSKKASLSEHAAALRLIAYAGRAEHARSVLPSLDDTANHIKVAAVNALRMMVDGDAPLDKLSSFDAIERAKTWKGRI